MLALQFIRKNNLKLGAHRINYGFSAKFPYNFDGYTQFDKKNHHIEMLQELFQKDINQGFLFAYKNLIQAIGSPNSESQQFIEENCDRYFYKHLIQTHDTQKIKYILNPDVIEKLYIDHISIHLGFKNTSQIYQKDSLRSFNIQDIKFQVYMSGVSTGLQRPIMMVGMYIKTGDYLYQDNNVENIDKYHYIVFRTNPQQSTVDLNVWKLLGMLRYGRQQKLNLLKEIYMGKENFSWLVCDMDKTLLP